jgi:tartrate dehydratase alpha subunit/fumarate hydratase class I-like protein
MKNPLNEKAFTTELAECIRQASCELPEDVEQGLRLALTKEDKDSTAYSVLDTIIKNIQLAKK